MFLRPASEHNPSTRCATEFSNPGRFRDQEFHIAVGGDVSDLLGPEDWMDGNKDGVGPKHPQDRNDLIERLLHADADAVARSDAQLGEGLGRRQGLGVKLSERQRCAPAEKGLLVGGRRHCRIELRGYGRHLSGSSY